MVSKIDLGKSLQRAAGYHQDRHRFADGAERPGITAATIPGAAFKNDLFRRLPGRRPQREGRFPHAEGNAAHHLFHQGDHKRRDHDRQHQTAGQGAKAGVII